MMSSVVFFQAMLLVGDRPSILDIVGFAAILLAAALAIRSGLKPLTASRDL